MVAVVAGVCLLLGAAALVQSAVGCLHAWENRRFLRSRLRRPASSRGGRVLLIVPCKGLDTGLEENLRPLLEQDYSPYELRLVVECTSDPAYDAIRRLVAHHPKRDVRLIVAGRSTDSGQKVQNLRAATADLAPEIEILAFVDSDARPEPGWLSALVGRLARPDSGAVTGYRWFVLERATLAHCLLSSLNGFIASVMGPGRHHLVWGGAWAVRREVFDSTGLRDAWRGTLSDDLVASRVLRQAGLPIEFEPAAMVASSLNCGWRQMFEFLRRQYVITRKYARRYWVLALVTAAVATAGFWASVILAATGLFAGQSMTSTIAAATAALLYTGHVWRGWLRQDAMRNRFPRLAMGTHGAALTSARRFDLVAGPLVALVNLIGIASSMFGGRICWRGITYRILRDGQVRILGREADAAVGTDRVELACNRETLDEGTRELPARRIA